MLEGFIEYIREEYPIWSDNRRKFVTNTNMEIQEKIKMLKKVHDLLQDEKVKEFASIIGYQEPNNNLKLLELHNSLDDFVKECMSRVGLNIKNLKNDKYPIYCYIKSQEPIISSRTGKRLCGYTDTYWNLQLAGYAITVSDKKENGKNREEFRKRNANNIIYLPEGTNSSVSDIFYEIQTEFIKEALRTDQSTAKRMVLQKHGKKNDK